jgi:hypothetical protein
MNNWKNFLLAQTLVIVCAGLPQFTGVHLSAHITSLGVMFMLCWRILSRHLDREVEKAPTKSVAPTKEETNNE